MKWIHSFNIGDLDMATYTILNNMLDEISKKLSILLRNVKLTISIIHLM